jgi:hypothetical protein
VFLEPIVGFGQAFGHGPTLGLRSLEVPFGDAGELERTGALVGSAGFPQRLREDEGVPGSVVGVVG